MNHRWDKHNNCIKCGLYREKETIKTRMAINHNINHYKYEVKYKYYFMDGSSDFKRPICWRTSYDD